MEEYDKADVVWRPIEELTKLANNPRTITKDEMDKLMRSIKRNKKFFSANPLILSDRTGELVIIGGNQRLEAAKRLGLTEVPTILMHNPTEREERETVILDNHSNGEYDMDILADEYGDLDLEELMGNECPEDFLNEQEPGIVEDEVPEVPEEPKAKLGDIYQLGNHRLMCGDSTKLEDIEKLMDGQKADMVFTDPPYLLETKGGCKGEIGKALKKQGNDIEFISNFDPDNFLDVLPNVFENNKINAYVFCNKDLLPKYLNWAVDNKYSYNVLIWKKPNAIPIGDSHRPDIEYLLLFRKNAIWNNGLKDANYSRCLEFSRETGLHPTMKPIKLITNEMQISSNKGSNILDFFGGSGSTLIACEQLDRQCYMMELDPHYVDVIIQRWEKLTGGKAKLISKGEGSF